LIEGGFCKKKSNGNLFLARISVPVIQFPEQEVLLNPYLLGVLLGDGCLSGLSLSVCLYEEDVRTKINDILTKEYQCTLRKMSRHSSEHNYRIVGITTWCQGRCPKGDYYHPIKKIYKTCFQTKRSN
jgi:hypothetical protein